MFRGCGVIVSADKDMGTVPGLWVRKLGDPVRKVASGEADALHMKQALMGDAVDGYGGCPGVGAVGAAKIVAQFYDPVSDSFDGAACWGAVLAAYAKKGLGEDEALRNARVARILRDGDYDRKKEEVLLWSPPSR